MFKISWQKLFPTEITFLIFILYILLFINQAILVTASQDLNNNYEYNIITVVLMTELCKFIVSVYLYCRSQTARSFITDVYKNKKVLVWYFVPASLYCLYNNLSFINLSTFDPTTYYLLLQLRVGITGILFQVIFRKTLTKKQWFSLLLLTVGCMMKQMNFSKDVTTVIKTTKTNSFEFTSKAALILVQTSCACLAGVYNEYLLKTRNAGNIFIQNSFMYFDSIICNVLALTLQGNLYDALSVTNLTIIFHYRVFIIIINNAAAGIVTSFFLKSLNSIFKNFTNAIELVLITVLSRILFGIPIYANTILSIFTVTFAVYLYSQNPVSNVSQELNDRNKPVMEEV